MYIKRIILFSNGKKINKIRLIITNMKIPNHIETVYVKSISLGFN